VASALNSGVHDDLDPTTKTVSGHSVVLVAEALVGMVAPADPGRNHGWAQRVCHCCRYDAADIEKSYASLPGSPPCRRKAPGVQTAITIWTSR